ncbi:hypothetical protein CTheo_7349 [Ceratobasidium theobromae]|uniref:Vegetative incompatibility protein HET-E-1 n=1 Tax=Ceratobasidium theobromae TaxID=1582974 RepID=A0A5N5QCN6_9AGAM|nr:hypothetical protein CTheo_7349 [Ceratobasidium theobromae]
MSSPPTSPQPRQGFRRYIDKIFRPRSKSPFQPSEEGSHSRGHSTSVVPNARLSTTGNTLAPPPASFGPSLRRAKSLISTSNTHAHSSPTSGLRGALETLHEGTRLFGPLWSAIGALISSLDVLEAAAANQQEYENIVSELKSLSESLSHHIKESRSFRMSKCIVNIANSIEKQAELISAKRPDGTMGRILAAGIEQDKILGHYKRIESLFRRLQTDANLSMWSTLEEHVANTRLEGLTPAKLASYDSTLSTKIHRRTCTEGTRTTVLSQMDEWTYDMNAPELYWMNGMAGTGKTTIACSFSNALEKRKQLAASFFCTRTSPECRQVNRIIPTIAYQLARYSIPFQGALCEVLADEPDISSKNIVKQMEQLLKEPLSKVKEAIPENLVVVIDALDECEDRYQVKLILDLLFKYAPSLPLKFFVTSRPEPEIYSKMVSHSTRARTVVHLHEIEQSLVQADIELYLREELSFMSLADTEIEKLVTRSGSFFIYAATLVRYISPVNTSIDPHSRLQSILGMAPESVKKHAEIDALYGAVLKSALDGDEFESAEAESVRAVLRTALCVQEPVDIEMLAILSGVGNARRALSALQPLRSVLHFSDSSGLVSTLHASFPDFMFDKSRSGPYFCDVAEHNGLLASRCFELMANLLRFNICNLESSFIPDAQVVDLKSRIDKAISPILFYACQYWGDHLQSATNSPELDAMLEAFLSIRLLFWMEVLNLKRELNVGTRVLVKVKLWLKAGNAPPDLIRFAEDAQSFLTSYAANSISQSTPHIYISSLPLCPKSNLVFKHYWERTRGMIELTGSGMERREMASLASWTVGGPIRAVAYSSDGSRVAFGGNKGLMGIRNAYDGTPIVDSFDIGSTMVLSIAFSPDGMRLVSGSADKGIRVWSTRDGMLILGPIEGHTGDINSVRFSPDGTLIVSGSMDHTVRIWNSSDGTLSAGPFEGHDRSIRSVAFSPDGSQIASGSYDQTIRIWDIRNQVLAAGPFKGHTGTVFSVAFSPDGTHVASGSADCTVRVWKAQDGTATLDPLKGHTGEINSISFSPDGTRIASASDDHTIIVWSLHDGTLVAGPFEGHIDIVFSVAFSPDGTRVVSGCGDHTIRVWNTLASVPTTNRSQGSDSGLWSIAFSPDGTRIASGSYDPTVNIWDSNDGALITGPLKGHTERIWSVDYSPDGAHIVSGSNDHTIRVWNSQDGALILGPLKGHTDAVASVSFSHDGTRIVSGSNDDTVRVWSSQNGELVAGPFKGHKNIVVSVAFSPDDTRIVSGSYDSSARMWNASDGTSIFSSYEGHTDWIMSVDFSPNGKLVASASKDQTVQVWNSDDGVLTTDPFKGHTDAINEAVFSPNGAYIVSGSDDRTVRVWKVEDGSQVVGPFYGHAEWVTAVAFSPDGTYIVSASDDHNIRMWDIRDGSSPVFIPFTDTIDGSQSPIANQGLYPGLWAITNEGWVVDKSGRLLIWVPPEVLRSLLTPHCKFIIGRSGSIDIDISHALLGHRWHGAILRIIFHPFARVWRAACGAAKADTWPPGTARPPAGYRRPTPTPLYKSDVHRVAHSSALLLSPSRPTPSFFPSALCRTVFVHTYLPTNIPWGRHSKCDRKTPCGACIRSDAADQCSLGADVPPPLPPLPPPPRPVRAARGIRLPIAHPTPSNPSIRTASSPLTPPPPSPPESVAHFPPRPIPAPIFDNGHSPNSDKDREILRLRAEIAALRPPSPPFPRQQLDGFTGSVTSALGSTSPLTPPTRVPPSTSYAQPSTYASVPLSSNQPQPLRRQPIPGKIAEAVRFQILQPIIDVMKDSWRRHIPLTMLTDKFCTDYTHAPPRDILQFDRSNRTLIPRTSDFSDAGEDCISVPEWIEVWKRLISLIESYQPSLAHSWLKHYHIVFMDTNFSALFHIWLAYDIQVRRHAVDEDLDPATFQPNIFECVKLAAHSDSHGHQARNYSAGSLARRRSRSPLSICQSHSAPQRYSRPAIAYDRSHTPPPRADVSKSDDRQKTRKRAKCLRCGSTDHQPRHCMADRRANEPSATPLTDPKDALIETASTAPIFAPSAATPTMTPSPAKTDPWKVITPLCPEAWHSLLSNLNLLSSFSDIPTGLSEGFRLGAGPPPPTPFTPLNHRSARDCPEAVRSHIQAELDAGRYSGPFDKDTLFSLIGSFRSSPLGVVPKSTPGEFRIIQDLSFPRDSPTNSSVNAEIDTSAYSCLWGFFDDIVEIVLSSPPGTTAATLDVDAAYRRMPIHPDDQPNLVVSWDNTFFVDHCAPFGAASSNGIFGRCGDAMQLILIALLKLTVRKWVDDFIVFRPPPDLPGGTTSIDDIYAIAFPLGWPWKHAKTCPFAPIFTFLGFVWSIPDRTVSIPTAKHQKYLARLDAWLALAESNLTELQQLTGTLVHCTHVIPEGRAWLSNLFRFCASFPHSFRKRFVTRPIPQHACDEAIWWRSHLQVDCTLHLQPSLPAHPIQFYMDASTSFGVAIIAGSHWASWRLLHPWRSDGRDIGWAEMTAVAMALEAAITLGIHDATVHFHSDNQGVVFALEAGRSRSCPQNELLKLIASCAAEFNIRLRTAYIASADNPADRPSRGLPPSANFSHFTEHIPVPTSLSAFLARATLTVNDTTPIV